LFKETKGGKMPEKTKNRELPKISEDNDKFEFTGESKTIVDENGKEHTLYRIRAKKDMELLRIKEKYTILDRIRDWFTPTEYYVRMEDAPWQTIYPVYRIHVHKGDLGGFIEKEENLDYKSSAWVFDDSMVYDDALVSEDAQVYDGAQVCGDSWVHGDHVWVHGKIVIANCEWTFGNIIENCIRKAKRH